MSAGWPVLSLIRHNCGRLLIAIDRNRPRLHPAANESGDTSMSLDTDHIVDRRRMRRKLTLLARGRRPCRHRRRDRASPACCARSRRGRSSQPISAADFPRHHPGHHPRRPRSHRGARQPRRVRAPPAPSSSTSTAPAAPRPARRNCTTRCAGSRRRSRRWWWSTAWRRRAATSRPWRRITSSTQNTSLVGSIGVLFQFPNVSDLLERSASRSRR